MLEMPGMDHRWQNWKGGAANPDDAITSSRCPETKNCRVGGFPPWSCLASHDLSLPCPHSSLLEWVNIPLYTEGM